MADNSNVSDSLMGPLKRVVRRLPVELKNDPALIQTIMVYLRLGGEKLARQAGESAAQTHELEVVQRKKKARHEALIRAAEARLAERDEESAANGDDYDQDDDPDDAIKAY